MSPPAEELKATLASLPATDRAELAQFLIHSLEEVTDEDSETAWDAELARRAEEIQKGSIAGESAEEVFRDLRKKHA